MEDLLGSSTGVFIGLTLVIVGGAAMLAGRAIAGNWKPAWQVVAAAFGLALADRFLVYALFEGPLLHLPGFLVAFAVLAGLGLLAWRITLVTRMVRQYPWRYRRTSLVAYEEKKA
ncbi:hypothetical protein SH611_16925 [Geminicoccaceae bacterium 1502E]|nr:hypothetical protein [Geminicoccaceae bacterium 1502E]